MTGSAIGRSMSGITIVHASMVYPSGVNGWVASLRTLLGLSSAGLSGDIRHGAGKRCNLAETRVGVRAGLAVSSTVAICRSSAL